MPVQTFGLIAIRVKAGHEEKGNIARTAGVSLQELHADTIESRKRDQPTEEGA